MKYRSKNAPESVVDWGRLRSRGDKIERAPAEIGITPMETEPGIISVEDDSASFIALQFPVMSLPHNPFTVRKNSEHKAGYHVPLGNFPSFSRDSENTQRHSHLFLVPLEASQFLENVLLTWGFLSLCSEEDDQSGAARSRVKSITSNTFVFTNPTTQVNLNLLTALLKFHSFTVYGKTPQVSPWLRGFAEDKHVLRQKGVSAKRIFPSLWKKSSHTSRGEAIAAISGFHRPYREYCLKYCTNNDQSSSLLWLGPDSKSSLVRARQWFCFTFPPKTQAHARKRRIK